MKYNDKTPSPGPPALQKIKWEYRSEQMDANAELGQFGEEGWELVSVVAIPHDPSQAIFHFKRRR